jgi:4-hydroxythreonine-4-phosphate dehydrogenase
MKPVIAITIGDINGIGPEVVLKSLADKTLLKSFIPILIGPVKIWEDLANKFNQDLKFLPFLSVNDLSAKYINVFDLYFSPGVDFGKIKKDSGFLCAFSIFIGHQLCRRGIAKALVTSPISKEALNLGGFPYEGHTELLAELSNTKKVCMVLLTEGMKVGLVTTHIPINEIPLKLTSAKIEEKLDIMAASLKKDFKIKNPRIAVLGLNPHAGDGGILGDEEEKIILPAIKKSLKKKISVSGPYAADGFFAHYEKNKYDAVLAMYHDQGLIPLKMFACGKGVNFTAGLDIIRTSPDHGTAFDIAGKNIADPASMKEAIKLAVKLANK